MLPSHTFCFIHSYYSMRPLCLYRHLLFIHAFALLILSTCLLLLVLSIFCSLLILFLPCLPSYCHITSSHILCILEHHLLICPSFQMSSPLALLTLLYSLVFFSSVSHSFHLCHPPLLHFTTTLLYMYFIHCYYLLPLLLTSQLYFSLFAPYFFLHLHFLSFSFYIFGTTYVWPFSVLLWLIIEDFCTL